MDDIPTYEEMLNMDLHRQLIFHDFMITRVPGGWIYTTMPEKESSCFVPAAVCADGYRRMT